MALSPVRLDQAAELLRIQAGDRQRTYWPDDDYLMDAIGLAIREAWPDFFKTVISDYYTATGTGGPVDWDAESINVPPEFIGGQVDSVAYRPSVGRKSVGYVPDPYRNRWTIISKGWSMDNLFSTTPQIRFNRQEWGDFEIRLIGRAPLSIPTAPTDLIDGSTIPGFMTWLLWQAEYYLRSGEHRSQQYDRDAFAARRLMAEQKATEARRRGRMAIIGETYTNRY